MAPLEPARARGAGAPAGLLGGIKGPGGLRRAGWSAGSRGVSWWLDPRSGKTLPGAGGPAPSARVSRGGGRATRVHSFPTRTPNWAPSEPRPKSLARDSAALGRSQPSASSPPLYRLGKLRKRQLTKVIPRDGGETGLRQPSCPPGPLRDHFRGPRVGSAARRRGRVQRGNGRAAGEKGRAASLEMRIPARVSLG